MSTTSVQTKVQDGLIDEVTLYQDAFWLFRIDVLPFLFVYILSMVLIMSPIDQVKLVGLVVFPLGLALHLLVFLYAQSSVHFRCFIGKKQVADIKQATYAHVIAAKNAGQDRIVMIDHNRELTQSLHFKVMDQKYALSADTFSFQEVTYFYNETKHTFYRLDYPIQVQVEQCVQWSGHMTNESVVFSFNRWGANDFHIPIPHFLDLYMEHLVAPFFVFQVLCLFLWSLDDYWYYSVFTLMMLMIFEGVMCNQRQNNVLMMRNMRRPPFFMYVYRKNTWMEICSDVIVPGDIVSLTADKSVLKDAQDHRKKVDTTIFEGKVLPCDVLLVRGNCVVNEAMLTGESVPKVKESVVENQDQLSSLAAAEKHVDITKHSAWSRHLLLGGTLLQQHVSSTMDNEKIGKNNKGYAHIPDAPDGGCVGIVIRTGFSTTQGELMRKILFATEGTTGNANETFSFITVLVMFAIVAAVAVLYDGIFDENRNKFRLVLHCIMIITSVVPPELPMELSLAVTNSLAALSKQMIFCTEPFRIAYAGRLNVVCFDKTGTLTKDEMVFKGIVGAQDVNLFTGQAVDRTGGDDEEEGDNGGIGRGMSVEMIHPEYTTDIVQCIMGCCHDLVRRIIIHPESKTPIPNIIGDPLEFASFVASGYKFSIDPAQLHSGKQSMTANHVFHPTSNIVANILHKYPFSSDLKRMSVMVQVSTLPNNQADPTSSSSGSRSTGSKVRDPTSAMYVFCKGAPEIMHPFLKEVPESYSKVYQYHMQAGKRVLALAYKMLATHSTAKMARVDAEKDLMFAGFLIFDSDLKADSKSVIKELRGSSHQVVMITGDSVYTAVNVGKRLNIVDTQRQAVVLHPIVDPEKKHTQLVWRLIDSVVEDHEAHVKQADDVEYKLEKVPSLLAKNVLCITGSALDSIAAMSKESYPQVLRQLCPAVTIFARVSPMQKEKIIQSLNDSGNYTLMCGDGTNDVGALKAAHVGVSIINNPRLESLVEEASKANAAKEATAVTAGGKKAKAGKGSNSKDRMARAMLEIQAHENEPSIVKLGDASIASPFTAKRTSIDSVLTVIRQGRCTLVTTIQVYKVLALNCLASAFMMSTLYLKGLKQGDTQMTCSGLVLATLFFFLSQAKPIASISDTRPPASVFNKAVSFSILGQFIVHLVSMYVTMLLCESYTNADDFSLSPDGKFTPNLINSAMFILSNQMLVNNFWVNYRGPPYMEELTSNIYFWRLLQGIYAVILIIVGGQFEPINDLLQLVPYPNAEFQARFLGILVMNAGVAYGIEKYCRRLE